MEAEESCRYKDVLEGLFMSHREISARKALEDIRAGMDDAALMAKYRLTKVGLQKLYRQLASLGLLGTERRSEGESPVITVKIRELVRDVRNGMPDAGLMEKYRLSTAALHMIFKKLLDMKALTPDDLFGDERIRSRSVDRMQKRAMDRYVLDFELNVFDAYAPDKRGTVRDITEKGLGVTGIDVSPGEFRTLVVAPDEFLEIQPFMLKAECRWCEALELSGVCAAGFKIVHVSEENRESLRKLIRLLTF